MQVKKKKKKKTEEPSKPKKKKRDLHMTKKTREAFTCTGRQRMTTTKEREQEPLPISDWKRAERRLRFTLAFTTVERLVLVISLAEIEKEAKSAS